MASQKVRSDSGKLSFLVMLKSFQRLGYFPEPELIPTTIIEHIRGCLKMGRKASFLRPEPSKLRYQRAIRAYLGVLP